MAQVIARRIAVAFEAARLQLRRLGTRRRGASRLEATLLQQWIRVFYRASWGAAVVDGADQRIEAVNPAFARLHGFPDPEA